jgi:hypothetical protein
MVPFIKTIAFLIAAILFAAVALLVPTHIRAVDQSVVELAGIRNSSPEAKISEAINATHIGPAERMIEATQLANDPRAQFKSQIAVLQEKNPNLRISGGADRAFEDFLKLIQRTEATNPAVVPLLLPRSERASLSGTLASSSNANVSALLEIRNLTGLIRLHPADHAAGAPYDAGVLTLAMLVEGGHFRPELSQQIGGIAIQASLGTPSAVRASEDLVIATLSLGRQLDYSSLASLAKITRTPGNWTKMATLFRAQPDRIDALYTALVFSENPDQLFNYLAEHSETGNTDLDFALSKGPGAVSYLLESEQPIYRPASIAAEVFKLLAPYRPETFISIALNRVSLGLALKFGLFFLAGLAFSFAMGAAWRGSITGAKPVSKTNPVIMARDALLSLVVVLTVWTFFEPDILKSQDLKTDSAPRIEFAVADTLNSLKSPVKAMQEINQVTLLVLALFFIIQLVIYSFCLIKMREITKQQLSPQLKIKLLENEENLFDFGLYVGLGGTVLSLILVAVGIVEASLMAAYASTLFGILFTALLKVMHVRPYRRELIMKANPSRQSTTLMENIEL